MRDASRGKDSVSFKPVMLKSSLPDASKQAWPMGDVLPNDPLPSGLDAAKLKAGRGRGVRSTGGGNGRLRGDMEGPAHCRAIRTGDHAADAAREWSMGKSVTATLMGVLIQQGVYELWQPAPIPEWQDGNDLRSEIRIADLLHMSSGLRIKALEDPDYDPAGTYPDHLLFIPAASTRSTMRPPGRCNGSRERSDAIETPTRS